jgi:hypothetical protein
MSYGCPPITLPAFAPVPDYTPVSVPIDPYTKIYGGKNIHKFKVGDIIQVRYMPFVDGSFIPMCDFTEDTPIIKITKTKIYVKWGSLTYQGNKGSKIWKNCNQGLSCNTKKMIVK